MGAAQPARTEADGGAFDGIRPLVLGLVFVSTLAALGIYQVSQRHRTYAMAQKLSTQTLKYRDLLDENRRLRLELATLKRFEHVRSQAENQLGMRVPAPQEIVEIRTPRVRSDAQGPGRVANGR